MTSIPSNVWEFLTKAQEDVVRIEADSFGQEMQSQIIDGEINSPIEQIFLIAMHVMCRAHYEEVDPEPQCVPGGDWFFPHGIRINRQVPVGKYRVDFIVSRVTPHDSNFDSVVVELDGHEFHDKDKRQRSYEKARDRALVKAGHRVFHYTGSDVVRDPYKVAHEVLDALHVLSGPEEPYDPANPFGID